MNLRTRNQLSSRRLKGAVVALVFIACLVATAAAVAAPAATSARGPMRGVGGTTIFQPIEFTIPAGQCSLLPGDLELKGSGTIAMTTKASQHDGVASETDRSVAWGTATDNRGGSYVFAYVNTFSGSSPGTAIVEDHFTLFGSGQARLSSGFKLRLTFGPDWELLGLEEIWSFGDPEHCDPI